MGFECAPCHEIATGKNLHHVHFALSHGACETCGEHRDCGHCQCAGDWAKARKEAALRKRVDANQRDVARVLNERRALELANANAAHDLLRLHQELQQPEEETP